MRTVNNFLVSMKSLWKEINSRQLHFTIFLVLAALVTRNECAPAIDDENVTEGGCYYMFNHYEEGTRIMTNEPCLNCTCHNSMLMCYLRVCPFTKPIGQDCTIEKKPDQCCPVITCPEVPVPLLPQVLTTTSTTTLATVPSSTTELAHYDHGCELDGKFYPDGAQVASDPSKPCELCYCIRNRTACVMQECILHVEGCKPVFEPGVCCPVRYHCDGPLEIETTTMGSIGNLISTTISNMIGGPSSTPMPGGCYRDGEYYADGSQIPSPANDPCNHCYCLMGEVVCAVQDCGSPLENEGGNCSAVPPREGLCCPEKYACHGSMRQDRKYNANEVPATDEGQTTLPSVALPSAEEDAPSHDETVEAELTTMPAESVQQTSSAKPGTDDAPLPETVAPAIEIEATTDSKVSTSTSSAVSSTENDLEKGVTEGIVSDDKIDEIEATTVADKETEDKLSAQSTSPAISSAYPPVESSTNAFPISETENVEATTAGPVAAASDSSLNDGTPTDKPESAPTVNQDEGITSPPVVVEVQTPEDAPTAPPAENLISSSSSTTEKASSPTPAETNEDTKKDDTLATTEHSSGQNDVSENAPGSVVESDLTTVNPQNAVAEDAPKPSESVVSSSTFAPTEEQTTHAEHHDNNVAETTVIVPAALTSSTASAASQFDKVTETTVPSVSEQEITTPAFVPSGSISSEQENSGAPVDDEGIHSDDVTESAPESPSSPVPAEEKEQAVTVSNVDIEATTATSFPDVSSSKAPEEIKETTVNYPSSASSDNPGVSDTVEVKATTSQIAETTVKSLEPENLFSTASPEASSVVTERQTTVPSSGNSDTQFEATTQGDEQSEHHDDVNATEGTGTTDASAQAPQNVENGPAGDEPVVSDDVKATTAPSVVPVDVAPVVPTESVPVDDDKEIVEATTAQNGDAQNEDVALPQTSTPAKEEIVDKSTNGPEEVHDEATTSLPASTSPEKATSETTVGSESPVSVSMPQVTEGVEQVVATTVSAVIPDNSAAEMGNSGFNISSEGDHHVIFPEQDRENQIIPVMQHTKENVTSTTESGVVTSSAASTDADLLPENVHADDNENIIEHTHPENESTQSVVSTPVPVAASDKVDEEVLPTVASISEKVPSHETNVEATTAAPETVKETTRLPVEPEDAIQESTSQPLTPVESIRDTTRQPVVPAEPAQETTRTPIESEEPALETTRQPIMADNTVQETTGQPDVLDDSSKATSSQPVVPDDLPQETTRQPAIADEPAQEVTQQPVVSDGSLGDTTKMPASSESINDEIEKVTSVPEHPVSESATEKGTEPSFTSSPVAEEAADEPETTAAPVHDIDAVHQVITSEVSATPASDDIASTSDASSSSTAENIDATTLDSQASSEGTTSKSVESSSESGSSADNSIEGASTPSFQGQHDDSSSSSEPDDLFQTTTIRFTTDKSIEFTSTSSAENKDSTSSSADDSGEVFVSTHRPGNRVPGEGSCFVEGITYANGSRIPPSTPCQLACACQNSIVHCLLHHCAPPPSDLGDCKPFYKTGICCPEYDCGSSDSGPVVTVLPESQESHSTTRAPVTITGAPVSPSDSSPASSGELEHDVTTLPPIDDAPQGPKDSADSSSAPSATEAPVAPPETLVSSPAPSQEPVEDGLSDPADHEDAHQQGQEFVTEATPDVTQAPVISNLEKETSDGDAKPPASQSTQPSTESVPAFTEPSTVVNSQTEVSSISSSVSSSISAVSSSSSVPKPAPPPGPSYIPPTTVKVDEAQEKVDTTPVPVSTESSAEAATPVNTISSQSDVMAFNGTTVSAAPPGSSYPVTVTTTVTQSPAPWPYPTTSTISPAMSNGACLFDGKVYMSAQQIPRDDPCDFCFCFRGDIICLQQSCPPPIPGCYEEPIPGFCCPRYECPVGNGNATTASPLFSPSYYHNQMFNSPGAPGSNKTGVASSMMSGPGCEYQGDYYETGQVILTASGPCLECRCGSTGMMECDPRECQPEPMLRKMIAAITTR